MNKEASVVVQTRNKTSSLVHTFSGIPRGARYEISVVSSVQGAVPANLTASAHPLTAPKLMSVYPEKNGSYVVMWKEVRDVQEK